MYDQWHFLYVCRWRYAGPVLSQTGPRRPVDSHPDFLPFWYFLPWNMMLWSEVKLSCGSDWIFTFHFHSPPLSDLVTDMDFSPFDESLLATCSGDETVSTLTPSSFSYFFFIIPGGVFLHINPHSILSGCVVPGSGVNMRWSCWVFSVI